jgi:hypothetical protein
MVRYFKWYKKRGSKTISIGQGNLKKMIKMLLEKGYKGTFGIF